MIHKKAKLIYYLNSGNRKYCDDNLYQKHILDMVGVLDAFGIYTIEGECCVWLYACNYPKDRLLKEFGFPIYEVVSGTNGHYNSIKNNNNSANLVLIDRIAHVNYFLENGKKSSFEAFRSHHSLFKKELFMSNQNPKMWAYLDCLMDKTWESLMCV